MAIVNNPGFAARTAYYLKKIQGLYPYWKINYKVKCESTEKELSNWLKLKEIKRNRPVVIIAKEQFSGFGQNSKKWISPKGGIWLSAAYPIFSKNFSCQIFSLSLAISLCQMLKEENVKVNLKWPNDILYDSKKLIGLLPRVITRGKETIYVRIGIGMNFLNKPPIEGISLAELLNTTYINEYYWTAKILKAFNDAIILNERKEYIIETANKLLAKTNLPKGYSPNNWTIRGLDKNGNLRIFNCKEEKTLKRF